MQRNDIYRIIDANINRASEALRVLEDWTRFKDRGSETEDRIPLNERLKKIRHEIHQKFSPFTNLILSRDSENDTGKDLGNPSKRSSIKDIIHANCKRAEESLRVLAEYGRLLEIDPKSLENFRYEIYTIEKELIKNEKLMRLQNARLYLVAGRDALPGRLYDDKMFLSIIEKSICGGVDIIQLREKKETEKKILGLAKEIKKLVCGTDVLFIVNDKIDIALAVDADGVHLGQDDMLVYEARKITPHGFIIGLSTHNIEQGMKAIHEIPLPDYIGVGPVFATPTKPDYKPAGLEYVKWASENIKEMPFFVIGGIDETNIGKVINAGASRIATVRAIMNAKDPEKMTKKLTRILQVTSLEEKNLYAKVR